MQHWQSSPIRSPSATSLGTWISPSPGSLGPGVASTSRRAYHHLPPISLGGYQLSAHQDRDSQRRLGAGTISCTDHLIPLTGLAIEAGPQGPLSFCGGNENIVIASAPPPTNTAITIETWFRWDLGLISSFCSKAFENWRYTTTVQGCAFPPIISGSILSPTSGRAPGGTSPAS